MICARIVIIIGESFLKMVFKQSLCGDYFISNRGVVVSSMSGTIVRIFGISKCKPYVLFNKNPHITKTGEFRRSKTKRYVEKMYSDVFGEEKWLVAFSHIARDQNKEGIYASFYASNKIADIVYHKEDVKAIRRKKPYLEWKRLDTNKLKICYLFTDKERADYRTKRNLDKRRLMREYLLTTATSKPTPVSKIKKTKSSSNKRKRKHDDRPAYKQCDLESSFTIQKIPLSPKEQEVLCDQSLLCHELLQPPQTSYETRTVQTLSTPTDIMTVSAEGPIASEFATLYFFEQPLMTSKEVDRILAKPIDYIHDSLTIDELFEDLSPEDERILLDSISCFQ